MPEFSAGNGERSLYELADVIVPSHRCLSSFSPDLFFTYSLLTMFVADMA
jgi:hypothetical protein